MPARANIAGRREEFKERLRLASRLGPTGNRLDDVTRVEGFGSPHVHWGRVRVDPDDPAAFGSRRQILREQALHE